jgi:hypothetical protein
VEEPQESDQQAALSPTIEQHPRGRSDTLQSTVSSVPGPQGQPTMTSMFFVVQALETIQNSKEGKRKGALKDSIAKALGMCLQPRGSIDRRCH